MKSETLINSSTLSSSEEIVMGLETGMLNLYDGLSSPFSTDVIQLSPIHANQIAGLAGLCAANYGPSDAFGCRTPEQTLVQKKFGLPTLVGRLDCTINKQGDIVAYELEDSPSGIGITDTIHRAIGQPGIAEQVRLHYTDMTGQLPFVIVSGARNHGNDDPLVVGSNNYFYQRGVQTIPISLNDDQLVIVKAIPGQPNSLEGYRELVERSVCTMESEGDKTYGSRIGLFQRVESEQELLVDDLTGEVASQALKRALGSMALGIKLYLDTNDKARYGKGRSVTLTNLKNSLNGYLEEDGFAYTQKFEPAIRAQNPQGRKNLILRVFTLLKPADINGGEVKVKVIGGCYVARSEVVVHGASNAVSGAVIVE